MKKVVQMQFLILYKCTTKKVQCKPSILNFFMDWNSLQISKSLAYHKMTQKILSHNSYSSCLYWMKKFICTQLIILYKCTMKKFNASHWFLISSLNKMVCKYTNPWLIKKFHSFATIFILHVFTQWKSMYICNS